MDICWILYVQEWFTQSRQIYGSHNLRRTSVSAGGFGLQLQSLFAELTNLTSYNFYIRLIDTMCVFVGWCILDIQTIHHDWAFSSSEFNLSLYPSSAPQTPTTEVPMFQYSVKTWVCELWICRLWHRTSSWNGISEYKHNQNVHSI